MGSVAASAATAVATAQSVAADRLRREIQASEEARARWARELHDETLQGLVGLRMLLASARRSDSPEYVEGAVSDALEQTRREIVNLRGLIAELRPAALDELGLDAAIETLSERSAAAAGTRGRDADRAAERRHGAAGARHGDDRLPAGPGGAQQRGPSLGRLGRARGGGGAGRRGRRVRGRQRPRLRPGGDRGRLRPARHARARRAGGRLDDDRLVAGRLRGAGAPAHRTWRSAAQRRYIRPWQLFDYLPTRNQPWPTDFSKSCRRSSPSRCLSATSGRASPCSGGC